MTSFPMVAIALFARVGFGKRIANHGDRAYFRSPSCQNLQPATRLGKFKRDPFIMAIPREKAGITPKPATRDPRFGEKPFGNGLSWRFPHEKAELTPKSARAWEKTMRNPLIMAIAKERMVGLAKLFGLAKLLGLART